jgi:hypothetical protein
MTSVASFGDNRLVMPDGTVTPPVQLDEDQIEVAGRTIAVLRERLTGRIYGGLPPASLVMVQKRSWWRRLLRLTSDLPAVLLARSNRWQDRCERAEERERWIRGEYEIQRRRAAMAEYALELISEAATGRAFPAVPVGWPLSLQSEAPPRQRLKELAQVADATRRGMLNELAGEPQPHEPN